MKIEFMVRGNPSLYQIEVGGYDVDYTESGYVYLNSADGVSIGFLRDVLYLKELPDD